MSSATEVKSELVRNGINKTEMFKKFQAWAMKTYGDSGKTKTVTRKKYSRIVNILTGEELSTAENSKFRFWAKAKGFRLGTVYGVDCDDPNDEKIIYVPTRSTNDSTGNDAEKIYKRVAVVDDFFDIIYGVHVEMDGRGGKHAGQKRTYRAIAETYAFLPREAVTKFLMSCSDCQKRMHLGSESTNNNNNNSIDNNLTINDTTINNSCLVETNGHIADDLQNIDFSVPITQTYLNHMRNKGYMYEEDFEESMSSAESEVSRGDHSPVADDIMSPKQTDSQETVETRGGTPVNLSNLYPKCGDSSPVDEDKAMNTSSKTSPHPLIEDRGHPERKRRASNDSCESSTRTSEGGTIDEQAGKEDEEDEENDDDEKMPIGKEYDPERLKAFNMFCRLFVDENLDRMVPISKQPKDKIQAILDACDRQFPEFHIRSRKRIRTYLKSCRRMRRTKEQNGWEPLRPTPPHLTSAAAEGLLAQACENESHNAKRMRMGLDPLPVRFKHANAMRSIDSSHTLNSQQMTPTPTPVQSPPQTPASISSPPQQQQQPQQQQPQQQQQQQQQTSDVQQTPQAHTNTQQPITPADRHVPANNDFVHHQPPPPSFRPPPEFHPPFFPNGNGLFRPGFPPGYQHPAHHHPPVLQHSPIQPTSIQNGPTDLSMKKQNSKNQLSSSEIATIKQLIAGYRESAAFLYRSADELEQLLLQQN